MLYYKATAGCGVGMFVGVSARKRAAPVTLILGRVAALPPPSAAFLSPSPPAAHSPVPSVCLAPSSRPPARPPPRTVSVLPSPCAALFCWASGRTLPPSLSEPWRRGIEPCVEESSLRRAMLSRLDVEAPVGVEPVTTIRCVEASSRNVEGQN